MHSWGAFSWYSSTSLKSHFWRIAYRLFFQYKVLQHCCRPGVSPFWATFRWTAPNVIAERFYITSLASLFPFSNSLVPVDLMSFDCVCIFYSWLLGTWQTAYPSQDPLLTIRIPRHTPWCNTSSVTVIVLMTVGLLLCVSWTPPRRFMICVPSGCTTLLSGRASSWCVIGVETVWQVPFVITGTPTVPSLRFFGEIGYNPHIGEILNHQQATLFPKWHLN